jgi:hypothetical protein
MTRVVAASIFSRVLPARGVGCLVMGDPVAVFGSGLR